MTASSASTTTVRSSWPLLNVLSIVLLVLLNHIKGAHTASPKKFVVFGSSGKTGLSIVNRILSENIADCQVICPVRNMAKARAVFEPVNRRKPVSGPGAFGSRSARILDVSIVIRGPWGSIGLARTWQTCRSAVGPARAYWGGQGA